MYELQWFEMLLLIEHNVFFFYFHRKGSKEKGVEEGLYCGCVCLSILLCA